MERKKSEMDKEKREKERKEKKSPALYYSGGHLTRLQ